MNPHRNVHRFAVFTACFAFLVLIAGALVTSNDAGLSVPDWPLSYGSLFPPMIGGIFYEHSHRMVAAALGLFSIILAGWLWRADSRSWVRWLGIAGVAVVIAQGLLGGLTVKFFLPPSVSAAHATLAQIFFSVLVSLAFFTSAWWERQGEIALDPRGTRIHSLAVAAVLATLGQLMLGAALRHKAFGIVPHLMGAVVVTGLIFWLAGTLRRSFGEVPALRMAARGLHALIGFQLLLGAAAWWARSCAQNFPQPIPITIALTVIHTVTGAIVLASTVVVTLTCYRMIRTPATSQKSVVATPAQQNAGRA